MQHLNEHICMTAARTLGLAAAVTRFEAFDDETAIVVERFDRTTRNGALVPVHQEDLCQALSVPPALKYQSDGGPTPGQIAELIRSTIPGPDAETDVWRFANALAFNWLIVGTDAHAKNYGLLLAGTQIRLAPLYDIASYLPYDGSNGYKVKLAISSATTPSCDAPTVARPGSTWPTNSGSTGAASSSGSSTWRTALRTPSRARPLRARTRGSTPICPNVSLSSSPAGVDNARRL
jgi:hypothetical protein